MLFSQQNDKVTENKDVEILQNQVNLPNSSSDGKLRQDNGCFSYGKSASQLEVLNTHDDNNSLQTFLKKCVISVNNKKILNEVLSMSDCNSKSSHNHLINKFPLNSKHCADTRLLSVSAPILSQQQQLGTQTNDIRHHNKSPTIENNQKDLHHGNRSPILDTCEKVTYKNCWSCNVSN